MTLKAVLALLQAGILAAGLALLGALVSESLERSLRSDSDNLLSARADVIEREIRARLQPGMNGSSLAGVDVDSDGVEVLITPGVFVEVWDGEGRRVAASRGLPPDGLPWTGDTPDVVHSDLGRLESLPIGEGERVRILTRPIVEDRHVVAVVRVGESLHLIDNALSGLVRLLLVGGTLVLGVCVLATWLVVSRALEPLEAMAATAEHIASTGDIGVSVSTRGTCEINRLGVAFGRMVERLRHLLQSQRQLLADTSHELRNPLTVIRTDLDLLGRELHPDTRQEVAAEAQAEAARMTRLVSDILFLAREEIATRGPLELVQLDDLASDVVERFRQVATDHVVEAGRLDSVSVLGEADRLRQMVANLVENGVRYSPAGSRITVDVRLDGGKTAVLEVADNGIGIGGEHIPRIFDRFYRVDPARGRSTGGTGLGLAIVKHVATSHSGTVEVASALGSGSRFTVRLPAQRPAGLAWPADPTAGRAGTGAAPSERANDSQLAETPLRQDRPEPHP
jgi:signal transduction histidine kinase